MRAEAAALYAAGEFVQSYSVGADGRRFDKEGVHVGVDVNVTQTPTSIFCMKNHE
jgi:hypothetical protein